MRFQTMSIGGMPMPRFWDGGICVLITENPSATHV